MSWVAIDFETANETRGSACALGVAIVEDRQIVGRQSWTIRPPTLDFSPYNVMIHGITAADVASAPTFDSLWPSVEALIAGRQVVAHHASFDISVLRHSLDTYGFPWPQLQYVCTRVLAKKVWTDLLSYSLPVVADRCGITFLHHDAEEDAVASAEVALRCCQALSAPDPVSAAEGVRIRVGSLSPESYQPCQSIALRPSQITPLTDTFDWGHPFFGAAIVFTGTLQSMVRRDAMQRVVNLGGHSSATVTKETTFLVVGDQDFRKFTDGISSSKMKKAQRLRAVASRWWWKSGRAWLQVGMLCGGRDGLGVGLVGGWMEEVSA
jgi:DNA polymerase III subunit epsilon